MDWKKVIKSLKETAIIREKAHHDRLPFPGQPIPILNSSVSLRDLARALEAGQGESDVSYDLHKDLGVAMVGGEEFYSEVVTIQGKEYGFLTQKIMLDACAYPTTTRSRIIMAFVEGINEATK